MKSVEVRLHIYDLSRGMARQFSQGFLGKQIDGIWHTGVVVYGKEWFYGGGIQSMNPEQVVTRYGMPPQEVIELGVTGVDLDVFCNFLSHIAPRFTAATYDLFLNNCNNFSNECTQFLLDGRAIPRHIIDLPNEALNSPMGAMLRPMFEQSSLAQPSEGGENNGLGGGFIPFNNTTTSATFDGNAASSISKLLSPVELWTYEPQENLVSEALQVVSIALKSDADKQHLEALIQEAKSPHGIRTTLVSLDIQMLIRLICETEQYSLSIRTSALVLLFTLCSLNLASEAVAAMHSMLHDIIFIDHEKLKAETSLLIWSSRLISKLLCTSDQALAILLHDEHLIQTLLRYFWYETQLSSETRRTLIKTLRNMSICLFQHRQRTFENQAPDHKSSDMIVLLLCGLIQELESEMNLEMMYYCITTCQLWVQHCPDIHQLFRELEVQLMLEPLASREFHSTQTTLAVFTQPLASALEHLGSMLVEGVKSPPALALESPTFGTTSLY